MRAFMFDVVATANNGETYRGVITASSRIAAMHMVATILRDAGLKLAGRATLTRI